MVRAVRHLTPANHSVRNISQVQLKAACYWLVCCYASMHEEHNRKVQIYLLKLCIFHMKYYVQCVNTLILSNNM